LRFLSLPVLLASSLTFGAERLSAQGQSAGRAEYAIQSAILGERRTVIVAPPQDYAAGQTAHPVLVLLDAEDSFQFSAAVANVAFLASRGEIPPLIVVGVPNGRSRTRDLTTRPRGRTAREQRNAGGAAAMASFIADEVMPLVRSKYRTLPSTVLAGHSFGGLFALHIAATRPNEYVGVIAMSPALWWNESAAARAYADSIAAVTSPLRVVATSGGLERDIDRTTRRFAARLDSIKPPTLGFQFNRYPNDTHALTPAASLVDGVRFIYAPLSLTRARVLDGRSRDSAAVVEAFQATQRTYGEAARALRVPEALPESFVNTVGHAVLRELRLPRVAAWMFRQNVTSYPESPDAYDSLGDALLASGARREAREQFQRSIDVAVQRKLPVDAATRRKLATLDRQLGIGRPK
jgi:predicted alpha/beta superfamily hydrolase